MQSEAFPPLRPYLANVVSSGPCVATTRIPFYNSHFCRMPASDMANSLLSAGEMDRFWRVSIQSTAEANHPCSPKKKFFPV